MPWSDHEDQRRYGKPAYEKLYLKGVQFLSNRFDISYVRNHQHLLKQELELVLQSIRYPGVFLSFIHDDLGNARQTYNVNDQLLLLDFEYAKYSHMLLDFVKPIIGKFEINLLDGTYSWIRTNFPLQLTVEYRKQLFDFYQICFEDIEWKNALYNAFTYGTIAMIGRLCFLEPDRNLIGTVAENIKALLHKLIELLDEMKYNTPLQPFIVSFLREA